jgi:hypothetical protein
MPQMTLMNGTSGLPDALVGALGQVVAKARQEWRSERELAQSETRRVIAEMEARFATLALELRQMYVERLAELHDGPPGPQGEAGARGEPGEAITGPPGEQGIQGPPGRFVVPLAWQRGVSYGGDLVTHAGATWCAMRDTAEEPPDDDWVCVAERGTDGRSPAFQGTWKAARTYELLDVVAMDGSSFVALWDAPGACPGDGWQLIASRGKSGPPGAPGPIGERGYPGPPGPAPVTLECDGELLRLRLSDGSTIDCDLYPVLARVAR